MEAVCSKHLNDLKKLESHKVSGYLKSEGDYDSFKLDLISNGFSFATRTSGPYVNDKNTLIFESGFPCMSIQRMYLQCCHGDLYYDINKSNSKKDHTSMKKMRVHKQSTKKIGCQSKINVKVRHVYPEYRANPETLTAWQKKKISKELKNKISDMCSDLKKETWYFIQAFIEHNHDISWQKILLHKELRSKIVELVESGVTSIPAIRTHLNEKVGELFVGKQLPDKSNSAFYPTDKVIQNQIQETMFSLKGGESGQEALEALESDQIVVLNMDNIEYETVVLNVDDIENYEYQEQEVSTTLHKPPNHLSILKRKLKNLMKMSYNLEDGEHLKQLLESVSSVEQLMGTYVKRENLVLLEIKPNKKKRCQRTCENTKVKRCKRRKVDQVVIATSPSQLQLPQEKS